MATVLVSVALVAASIVQRNGRVGACCEFPYHPGVGSAY